MTDATLDPEGKPWAADHVERWAIEDLIPYAGNPNTHPPAQVEQIVRSIQEFGWTTPILVDEGGGIIAGHGRVMAAMKLGLTSLPVMVATGWTEAQKRAYVIADNQIPRGSEWDIELLKVELGELQKLDFDLALTGFDDIKLVEFMTGLPGEGGGAAPPIDPAKTLAERFGVPPFSVLNAREGWWQERKRAWIALGIQSELGRGETPSTSARTSDDEPTTYRPIGGRKPNAIPGGARLPLDRQAKPSQAQHRGDH